MVKGRNASFAFTALAGNFGNILPSNPKYLVMIWGLEAIPGTLRLYPPRPGVAATVFIGVTAVFLTILLFPFLLFRDVFRDTAPFVGLLLLELIVVIAPMILILYRLNRWYARFLVRGTPKSRNVRAVRVRYTGTRAQELRLAIDATEEDFMVFATEVDLRSALELAGQSGFEEPR